MPRAGETLSEWTCESEVHEPELSWNGPYPNTYLHGGPCLDESGNPYRFTTLEEAMAAANDIDDCQGITKYPRNGYELRKVADIRYGQYAKEASWIKGGFPIPEPEPAPEYYHFEDDAVREAASTEISGMTRHISVYLADYPEGGFDKWGFNNKDDAIAAFHRAMSAGITVSGITFQKRYSKWIWSVRAHGGRAQNGEKKLTTWSWIPK